MAGAYILGCAGLELTASERAFFRLADPWGFILFERNIGSKAQVARLTADLRETIGREAAILIDQEGGRVQRMWPPVWESHLSALDLCDGAIDPARAMYVRSKMIAHELREIGIDVNCAPLADIAEDATHPRLQNRCYGRNVEEVAKRARAVAEGQLSGGVLPVLKHIPGHGSATKDSHVDLPVVTRSAADLSTRDFAAFKALADLPMGMTAHVVFKELDPDNPATTSATMNSIIRNEIGFDGLLMTDDLSMDALKGSVSERCAASLAAGCDVILHCNGDLVEMEDVAAAGAMSSVAEGRAAKALELRRAPDDVDISALRAELHALTESAA